MRKGSFPLALSFFQTFSGGRGRGGEERWGLGVDKKKDLFLGCPLLQEGKGQKKKSRRRTTLPHSVVQYHRREASYRSCSGWEREFQACYEHREKI